MSKKQQFIKEMTDLQQETILRICAIAKKYGFEDPGELLVYFGENMIDAAHDEL